MLPRERVAPLAGHAVVRQDLGVHLAGGLSERRRAVAEQVAELRADLQTALGHQARRDRGVVVRREIEVIRRGRLEAAHARRAERRGQEAGLALVRQRELQPRRIHDRDVEEMHGHAVRRANLAQVVDLELVAAQVPVGVRRDARRVARVARLVLVGPGEADLGRVAARVGLLDEEARLAKEADLGVALVLELRAGDPVEAAAQHHVAVAVDRLRVDVVGEPIGEHRLAPRAQLHVPFRRDPPAVAFETVGAQEQRAARFRLAAGERPGAAGGGRRHERGRGCPPGHEHVDVARKLERQGLPADHLRARDAVQGGPGDGGAGGKLHRMKAGELRGVC